MLVGWFGSSAVSLSLATIVSYVCSGMTNVNSSAAVSVWFLGGACEAISLSRACVYGWLLAGCNVRNRAIISFRLSVRLSLTASDRKCASILCFWCLLVVKVSGN